MRTPVVIFSGLALVFAGTAPVVPSNSTFQSASAEAVYDTPDGSLTDGYYITLPDGQFIVYSTIKTATSSSLTGQYVSKQPTGLTEAHRTDTKYVATYRDKDTNDETNTPITKSQFDDPSTAIAANTTVFGAIKRLLIPVAHAAIASDGAAAGIACRSTATGLSVTCAITVTTNTNGLLWTGVLDLGNASGNVTGCTFANGNETQIASRSPLAYNGASLNILYMFYMASSTTAGTYNVTCNRTAQVGSNFDYVTQNYTGAANTSIPEAASSSNATTIASISGTVTTITNNSWTVLIAAAQGSHIAPGTSSKMPVNGNPTTDSNLSLFESTLNPVTPAGSNTITVNATSSNNLGQIMVSFAPPAAASASTPNVDIIFFQ